jgi:hypothetical protein
MLLLVYYPSRGVYLADLSELAVQKDLDEEINGSCSEPSMGKHRLVVRPVEGASLVAACAGNKRYHLVFEDVVESGR